MDIRDEEGNLIHVEKAKISWWQKLGGGAFTFAAVFHIILLSVGGFVIFQVTQSEPPPVDFMPPGGGSGQRSSEHSINQKRQAQITPSNNVKRVFVDGATAAFSIPDQGDSFGEMSALTSMSSGAMVGGLGGAPGAGMGAGAAGAGMGMGAGVGKLFGMIPEAMRKRCSKEDRIQRLTETGGTLACEEAVLKALRYFKGSQNQDGSWGEKDKIAMTGLVLLCYFGHCETPASEEFGDSCQRGIVYLVNQGMKNDGRLATNFTVNSWPYEHAIATYALGEALTFCKEIKANIPGLAEVTQKSGQYIIDNQHKNGGWAYLYSTEEKGAHTDVSVVGWQLQALKACSHTNLPYKGLPSAVNKGLSYLQTCQDLSGGFGYKGPKSNHENYHTLTGVGMLCHQMWGKKDHPSVLKAAKYIMEKTKFDYNTEFCDLYGHYYESQAMMQLGGTGWKQYNELFRDQLLNNQNPDGTWKVVGGGKTGKELQAEGASLLTATTTTAIVYRTALSTLMLEVYYRFLNTGGGASSKPGI